ncbi:hypothetical protein HMJ29_18700 [Hymenobacter taeanensis]|uniref:Uncharacterized protein n=1 Tax=Hymenobacter taeanensis TaxID=2735321 RepID=A0A6M6BLY3_9BACT|nr:MULTISPECIES: DUF6252 family protein [Hymenobacter]QJX48828.1 hypothetical protein HMJ29_18700 [Hymenobacter taeanensis]UOQ81658.1 DUF6252 family protein [Hymenobacter sp. 5414T-23]
MLFPAKTVLKAALFPLLFALLSSSCSKNNVPPDMAPLRWNVDGNDFSSRSPNYTLHTGGTIIELSGSTRNGGEAVQLYMPKKVGSYTVGAFGSGVWASYISDNLYQSVSGTITVTSASATAITGTFSFTAEGNYGSTPITRTITGGIFNVPF